MAESREIELQPGWLERQFAELERPYSDEEIERIRTGEFPLVHSRVVATFDAERRKVAELEQQLQQINGVLRDASSSWDRIEFGPASPGQGNAIDFEVTVNVLGPGQAKNFVFYGKDIIETLDRAHREVWHGAKSLSKTQRVPGFYDERKERIAELEEQVATLTLAYGEIARRLHLREDHNQHFERCESAWCNPLYKDELGSLYIHAPALESARYREKERREMSEMIGQLNAQVATLTGERDAAREAIRQAKHDEDCEIWAVAERRGDAWIPLPCTCWKAVAMKGWE